MTVPYSVNDNDVVLPADVNQYKKMLEGASGYTTTYDLHATSNTDFNITLGDSAGVRKFNLKDSAGNVVYAIDSDGSTISGPLSPSSLILPTSAAPSQTAEGSIFWDSDDDVITVGDGASRQTFYSGRPLYLAASSSTATSTTSTSAVDLVTISGLTIAATAIIEMVVNARKTATTANNVAFGLKMNSTVVYEVDAGLFQSSGTNRAENGMWYAIYMPRRANYPFGVFNYTGWSVSSTGGPATTASIGNNINPNALMPQVEITSLAIRAINTTASNAAEIQDWKVWTK